MDSRRLIALQKSSSEKHGNLSRFNWKALDTKTQKEIEALGKPEWIVVPNDMHRMDVGTWKATYPTAKVVCPKAARSKVEEEVIVDGLCEDVFKDGPIIAHAMAGVSRTELSYELKLKNGKALIVNDLIVNIDDLPGMLGKVLEFMGRLGRFRVPTPQKILFLYEQKLFKIWLEKMAQKNFSIVTVSHGRPITENISLWLRSAALNFKSHAQSHRNYHPQKS
jgi:hypothetical protein